MKLKHLLDRINNLIQENNLNPDIELEDSDDWIYSLEWIELNRNEKNKLVFKVELVGEKIKS